MQMFEVVVGPVVPLNDDQMANGEVNRCAAITHKGTRCKWPVFYGQHYTARDDKFVMSQGDYDKMLNGVCSLHTKV